MQLNCVGLDFERCHEECICPAVTRAFLTFPPLPSANFSLEISLQSIDDKRAFFRCILDPVVAFAGVNCWFSLWFLWQWRKKRRYLHNSGFFLVIFDIFFSLTIQSNVTGKSLGEITNVKSHVRNTIYVIFSIGIVVFPPCDPTTNRQIRSIMY